VGGGGETGRRYLGGGGGGGGASSSPPAPPRPTGTQEEGGRERGKREAVMRCDATMQAGDEEKWSREMLRSGGGQERGGEGQLRDSCGGCKGKGTFRFVTLGWGA
jgi:hypothetical protein